jgi:hypothetical protein
VIRNRLGQLDLSGIAWSEVTKAARGHSHAEIIRACEQAAKDAILDERATLGTRDLVKNLADRHTPRE